MSQADPIKVYGRNGKWLISYGNYSQGWYDSRSEAIEVATAAAFIEGRELTIEAEPDLVAASTAGTQAGGSVNWDA